MKIGILGSGMVGQILGRALVEGGHDIVIGTRTPEDLDAERGTGDSLGEWLESVDQKGRVALPSRRRHMETWVHHPRFAATHRRRDYECP